MIFQDDSRYYISFIYSIAWKLIQKNIEYKISSFSNIKLYSNIHISFFLRNVSFGAE